MFCFLLEKWLQNSYKNNSLLIANWSSTNCHFMQIKLPVKFILIKHTLFDVTSTLYYLLVWCISNTVCFSDLFISCSVSLKWAKLYCNPFVNTTDIMNTYEFNVHNLWETWENSVSHNCTQVKHAKTKSDHSVSLCAYLRGDVNVRTL